MVKNQLGRHQTEAICDVCDSRGWGSYVGTFEYDPDELSTWTFTTNWRQSKLRASHGTIGDINSRDDGWWLSPSKSKTMPRSMPDVIYRGIPLRLRCPSGHRLAVLDDETVMRLLEGDHDKVRLQAG